MMRGLMPWMGTMSLKNEIDRLFDRLAELKGNEVAVDGPSGVKLNNGALEVI